MSLSSKPLERASRVSQVQTGATQSKSDSEGEDCSSTDNGDSTEEEDENLTSENFASERDQR